MTFFSTRFVIIILLSVVINSESLSQKDDPHYLINLNDSVYTEIRRISSIRKNQRTHNLYLNTSWQHSVLVTMDDRVFHFNGRYSVLDNAVQWQYNNQIGNIYSSQVKSILVGDKLLQPFKKAEVEGAERNVFLEVLVSGELNLFIHHFLDTKMSGSNSITSSFNGQKEYFLSNRLMCSENNGTVKSLKTRKKKILSLFKERSKEVEAFVAENNLKYNDQEDLKKVFSYFNQNPSDTFDSASN